jgi:hypothetical protein
MLYVVTGLFFAPGFDQIVKIFPLPILGVILIFEGARLVWMVRDVATDRVALFCALLVGALVVTVPYGFLVGLVSGTLVHWALSRLRTERRL